MKLSQWLAEAGRRHNASDQQKIQDAHDAIVAAGASCATAESEREDDPSLHLDAAFAEALGMSFGDISNLLRAELQALYPGKDAYVWTRDVYNDSVIYSVNDRETYQRSYSILDGKVTFGVPVKVVAVTSYVAVSESDQDDDLDEREFSQNQRDKLAKSGAALPSGGFPIATVADLKNAIQALGRAKNKAAAKAHIIKRAKALKATDELPADWPESTKSESAESATEDLIGDLVPLVERAVKKDGTALIRIISPGQGSSGYYPAEVLQRDAGKFGAGTHVYLDHPSKSEESDRPERSVKDLAGSLTGPAEWREDGLYAPVKFIDSVAPHINAVAAISGMSIRAAGTVGTREVGGKKVRSIESVDVVHSVDVVTRAGANGKVMDLIEAARSGKPPAVEEDDVSQEELAEANRKIAALEAKIEASEKREADARLLREAHAVVVETLKGIAMPDMVRERLTGQLASNPPTKDGALDKEALVAAVTEAAKAELAYLTEATGTTGRVTGMGGEPPKDPETPKLEESEKRIAEALKSL